MALLDQCACGGEIEGQYIRKRSHFQSSQPMHHLNVLCPGGHPHLHLRGNGRAASAARYPEEECHLILQECTLHSIPAEGGRYTPSETFDTTTTGSLEQALQDLRTKAYESEPTWEVWNQAVQPWLDQHGVKLNPVEVKEKVKCASAEKSIGNEGNDYLRAAPAVDPVEE